VARISLDQIVARLVPFVLVIVACLMIITYVPPISLYLRDLVFVK
jgi:TRAP-type C4-dicarboxylate transport system permease large subunit